MGDETFYCSCGEDFDERPLLEIHKQKCPTIKEIWKTDEDDADQNHELKENKPPKVDQFKCDKYHNYRVNPKLTKFQCDKCDRVFNSFSRLRSHNYQVHPKQLHKCCTCDRIFKSKPNLKRHQLVHTGEKPFSCELCGKGFTQKNNLKMHTLSFHPAHSAR